MSLVVALPYRDGLIVAGDKAAVSGSKGPEFGASKLHLAGGLLFSPTGLCEARGPDGRRTFSLAHVISQAAPSRMEPREIPGIAKAAGEAMKRQLSSARTDAGGGAVATVMFWLPTAIASFALSHVGASSVSEHRIVPDGRCSYVAQGPPALQMQQVMRQLSPSSTALIGRRPLVRDVSFEDAIAFVSDVQEAAARALPQVIGGGVDIRLVGRDGVTVIDP